MADDDADDRMLAKEALEESRVLNDLRFVEDGEELMDYLNQRGKFSDAERPGLILLDLNMPKKDGREASKRDQGGPRPAADTYCRDDDIESRRRYISKLRSRRQFVYHKTSHFRPARGTYEDPWAILGRDR